MSVSGLCQICEAAEATHDCDRCGALVCDEHWNRSSGYCVECAAELGVGGEQNRTPSGPGAEDITPPDTDDETHQL
ncbi:MULTISPECIES: hypothetical protein [unclassified Haladaptatus]|uniref:hypothetical protein n=1 Tax=unclassified Haladaptatus TaxID=2622732 RepID=UPI0007B45D76|nr:MULTISPECIES: hypothetical protein [unclassified Haladaptatus]KZN25934.1 hypothetical protein A4G99_03415 [Haladaptatus sp. R4]MCO8243146.1 hypothetical protein [Haladaptatus sp. AB643]MCO8252858.1 hypothetical protein [Haladaptatus sp. AB618]